MKVWCHKICFDQVRLRQKYYAPQVRPDWGLKPWPDHDSTFHVTEMSALSLGHQWHSCYSSTLFLCAHEHMYFMECALSQNVLLPLLMVHFVTRMYYYYHYYLDMLGNIHTAWDIAKSAPLILHVLCNTVTKQTNNNGTVELMCMTMAYALTWSSVFYITAFNPYSASRDN